MVANTPKPLVVSGSLIMAGAAALVYSLTRFWGANPEYIDRFLIFIGVGYAITQAWPALRQLPNRPNWLGYLPLIIGAIAFPVGWYLVVNVGHKAVMLWWLTGSWVLIASGFAMLIGGWSYLRRLAFPLGFIFFALPVPHRILAPLQFLLQSATTTVAAWLLLLLGVPVEQSGFILSLPGGDLGVAEACSGVRSVTALTAIAAFVAWWREFAFLRGIALVVLSVPIIAGVNAARVVLSGLIQEQLGSTYVRGNWHEALGVGMVLLGLGVIIALATVLERLKARPDERESEGSAAIMSGSVWGDRRHLAACLILICSALAAVSSQYLGSGADTQPVLAAPLEQISHKIGRWTATDLPVPDDVAATLGATSITRRVYSELGYDVHVWVMFWPSTTWWERGYHHPDVCWPNRGFNLTRRDTVDIPMGAGTIPVTVREFAHKSKVPAKAGRETDQQLILYWTQENRRIWSEEDEQRAQGIGYSHVWIGERLFFRDQNASTARLVVLLGTPMWGDGAMIRRQTLELAGQVAEELYRVCPWANPTQQ